jgi:hypothetical protein
MILAGIAVSTTVYFITKSAEIDNFEAMYEGASEKLLGTTIVCDQSVMCIAFVI